jgi:conjugative relaxase-like TrwC/TraI family protein
MISISKPISPAQARSYHREQFASQETRYYSQDGQVIGKWHGRLATEWGLRESVIDEHFARLTEGQHPLTGERLIKHRQETEKSIAHRAGWDATLNAPKSVSIATLVGGDNRIRLAHQESVKVALDELERYIQARLGGNKPAETTGRMVAAKFEHDSARPVDGYAAPHLHTHAVIFNVTRTDEGKYHALQPRELYKSQRYASAVYRSELAARLAALGYELEQKQHGEFEIKGFTPEYLEASSPRRQEIKRYLEEKGVTGSEAAEIAAHSTREAKLNLNRQDLLELNRRLAAEYGNNPQEVVGKAIKRATGMYPDQTKAAWEAITWSRDRNFEREAVADERMVLRDALNRAQGKATLGALKAVLEQRIKGGEFVKLADGASRLVTTARMIAMERSNINRMARAWSLEKPLVSPEVYQSLVREFGGLSAAQWQAARGILESNSLITGFQGLAGTGKTASLGFVRLAAERDGYRVEGFAPTSRAAQQLEAAGIRASTLQKFLAKMRHNHTLRHLYILDESSLAGTKQIRDFLNRLGSQDRLLLVGDIKQHQAVDAGRPFEQLQEAGMKTVCLNEILRQQDPELRSVVKLAAEGRVQSAILSLYEQNRVHEIRDSADRIEAVARAYVERPENTLVISPDNASRHEINRRIHQVLKIQGIISQEEYCLTVLANRHELTGADRQWAARYNAGDVIRYTRGSKELKFAAGEYVGVTQADHATNELTIERQDRYRVTYDPKRLHGVTVYKEETIALAVGDRVQFTAPFKAQNVANRQLGRIEAVDKQGRISIRLDSGRSVSFNLKQHPHLDYGYAMTSYSSQGQAADRMLLHVFVAHPAPRHHVNRRMAYVALSRARLEAQVFTNDVAALVNNLGRDVSKAAAIELNPAAIAKRQERTTEQGVA